MHITGGFLKSRKIDSPKGSNVRPTLSQMRESIFSTLFSLTDFENKLFLDVFAGSGIMGFEAISRGFASCDFIEKDRKTFFTIKNNIEKLGIEKETSVHPGDSLKILKKLQKTFDVIYIDPPYQSGLYDAVLQTVKDENLLSDSGVAILEHPKGLKIDTKGFKILKQKTCSDKCLTYLAPDTDLPVNS